MSSTPVITILYEDQDVLAINKAPELVINRSETTPKGTLQDWLVDEFGVLEKLAAQPATSWQGLVPSGFNTEYGTPADIFQDRLGVVHRLDKDTSGVLLLAKNPGSLVNLMAQFRTRKVHKTYLALVHGKFAIPSATLSFPLARASHDRKQFAVQAGGREAVTKYQVKQFYPRLDAAKVMASLTDKIAAIRPQADKLGEQGSSISRSLLKTHPLFAYLPKLTKVGSLEKLFSVYQGFSLVECWPQTGRTHQIRVHLKHIHRPIVGDEVYVGKSRKKLDELWCPRQFLHAAEVEFTHPRTGQLQRLEAPLWPDLDQTLSLLAVE